MCTMSSFRLISCYPLTKLALHAYLLYNIKKIVLRLSLKVTQNPNYFRLLLVSFQVGNGVGQECVECRSLTCHMCGALVPSHDSNKVSGPILKSIT